METRKISVIVECAADKSFAARATESVNKYPDDRVWFKCRGCHKRFLHCI